MKYAINTNYFRKECTNREIIRMALDSGVDGIEWGLGALEDAAKDAALMGRMTHDAGLEICGFLNAGVLWKYDEIRRWSDAVAAAGGQMLRVAHPWYAWDYREAIHQRDSYLELLERTRKGLEGLQQLGRDYSLRYVLETHSGAVAASAYSIYLLMRDLDPATVGAIYDPANMVLEGFVRPSGAVELFGPYLAYLHAKNLEICRKESADASARPEWAFQRRTLQSGMVDYEEIAYALKLARFDGWISFEEPTTKDPNEAILEFRADIEHLKQCFDKAPDKPQEPFLTFND